jgi:hypothetical protein
MAEDLSKPLAEEICTVPVDVVFFEDACDFIGVFEVESAR